MPPLPAPRVSADELDVVYSRALGEVMSASTAATPTLLREDDCAEEFAMAAANGRVLGLAATDRTSSARGQRPYG